ncbi:MAG: hypothetical protein QXK08_04610 [Candidatus Woesearchaeota archaeon]
MGDSKNLEQRTRAVFIICPGSVAQEESIYLRQYVDGLRQEGYQVYYPPDNTHQADTVGLAICTQNRTGMKKSREVRIFYNPASEESKFDVGMAFMAEKPFGIINKDAVVKTASASFENFLLDYEGMYSSAMRADSSLENDGSICMVCPNDVNLSEFGRLDDYAAEMHAYCPEFGAQKPDVTLLDIYTERRDAIRRAKEVHVFWTGTERDDRFGLGMAFMAEKPILLINRAEVQPTPEKSFNNVLLALDDRYKNISQNS